MASQHDPLTGVQDPMSTGGGKAVTALFDERRYAATNGLVEIGVADVIERF